MLLQKPRLHSSLIENSTDIVTVLSAEGLFRYASPSFTRILGYGCEEILGRRAFDSIHSDDLEKVREVFESILPRRGPMRRTIQFRFRHADGTYRWIEAVGNNQMDESEIRGIVLNARDVTDRHAAEEKFRVLFDFSSDPHLIIDDNGVIDCNPAALRALRAIDKSQIIGQHPARFSPDLQPDGRRSDEKSFEVSAMAKEKALNKGVARFEWTHRRLSGEDFPVEVSLTPVTINSQDVFLAVWHDLSEIKRTQRELKASKQSLEQALLGTDLGVWDWDVRTGKVIYSDLWAEMLEYSKEEIEPVYATWERLIHPADMRRVKGMLQNYIAGKRKSYEAEIRMKSKSGKWKWILTRGKICERDAKGQALRIAGTHLDITERKQAEVELGQSRKLRSLGELVGGITHEFNNLLAPMLMQATEISEQRRDDAALQAQLGPLLEAIYEAKELTNRILLSGRKSEENREVLALSDVARETASFVKNTIDRRVGLKMSLDESLPPVFMSRTDLSTIIINMLLNARDTLLEKIESDKFSPRWSPTIQIETRASGPDAFPIKTPLSGWQLLRITDNGLGMSEETRERIFEPFFTTKRTGKGTGLGLTALWQIVTGLGGHVELESKEGEGTSFLVYLPNATPAERTESKEELKRQLPKLKETRSRRRSKRLLYVEDNAIVARSYSSLLQKHGYDVSWASDGEEGWRQIAEKPEDFDIILTDLNMPALSGADFIEQVKKTAFSGKIVVVSGFVMNESETRKLGAHAILRKPLTPSELLSTLTGKPKTSED